MGLPKASRLGELSLRCILGVAAFACLGASWSTAAEAAPYDVEICTPTALRGDGIQFSVSQGATLSAFQCENPFDGAGLRLAGGAISRGAINWTLLAPRDTTIRTLEANRVFSIWGNSGLRWDVVVAGAPPLEVVIANGTPAPPERRIVYQVNEDFISGRLFCPTTECNGSLGTSHIVSVRNVIAHMEDDSPPALTKALGGSLLVGGGVSGMREVSFSATDLGSGLATATLLVDGAEMATLSDSNGGKCVKPYKFLVPCTLAISSSLPLDTTRLADGNHDVQVAVDDAAGQRALSAPVAFTVENKGAAPPPGGSQPPPQGGQHGDTTAPVLNGVSLSRKQFRIGTILRFGSSEAGRLSLAIERVRRGKRAKRLATLTRAIESGRGSVPLSGRIGRKPLAAGNYRVTVTARDAAGNTSAPVRRSFTIVPG